MSVAQELSSEPGPKHERRLAPLALAALGVVFGDIGTSPLYAFKLAFTAANLRPSTSTVLGILSLITWALILVVCVKYASVVLRADNDGEGGTFALLAQLLPSSRVGIPPPLTSVALLLLFAAGMVFGDGVITPAISVLSAIEGVGVAAPSATAFIVPITIAVLLTLFFIQSRGTGRIGAIFGPVMALWFAAIGAAGIAGILHSPDVLRALNPIYAIAFIEHFKLLALVTLGTVVLCVTGVEAMFADLAHFGRRPILYAWYVIAMPALLCNYYGQGAMALGHPATVENPFFLLFPAWATVPIVVLAALATVIASQALITGAFSLTQQAVQLGYLPRLDVTHTSDEVEGQIFMPLVNVLLAVACISLVLIFHSSSRLGSAYGLAVTVTMFVDSLVIGLVLLKRFHWTLAAIVPLVALFLTVDSAFLLGNLPKLPQGGYIPVAIAAALFTVFTTWTAGRRRLAMALADLSTPVAEFVEAVGDQPPRFEDGTAIFLTPHADGIPFALRHHWLRTRILREEVALLTIITHRRPYVDPAERVEVERILPRLARITAHYGFMELPDLRDVVRCCQPHLPAEMNLLDADYYFARPRIVHRHGDAAGLPSWRRWLLRYMLRNATPLTDSLQIPPDRIIEFGVALHV